MQKRNNFLDKMDQFFVVHGEKIPGKGEDSFLLSVNERAGLAAVFDGCGGSGARVYKDLGGKTGAYIAARVLSDTMCGWFEDSWDEDERVYRISDVSLKKAIDARLSGLRQKSGAGTVLKGSMTKEFPSTLAAAVLCENENGVLADFLWSGDSRVYILDSQGWEADTTLFIPASSRKFSIASVTGRSSTETCFNP